MKWSKKEGYEVCETPFGQLVLEIDIRYNRPFYLSTPNTHTHHSTEKSAKAAAKRYIQRRIDSVLEFAAKNKMGNKMINQECSLCNCDTGYSRDDCYFVDGQPVCEACHNVALDKAIKGMEEKCLIIEAN